MCVAVYAIDCYQCNSTDHKDPFQCGEYMNDDTDIEPKSCDSVYGAAYCIKHTGRFEGDATPLDSTGVGRRGHVYTSGAGLRETDGFH